MEIQINSQKVARLLLMLTVGLILAHIVGKLIEVYLGRTWEHFLFDLNGYQSIPKIYSTVILLLCSSLLLTIAVAKKGDFGHSFLYWLGLALIFLFLGITEYTGLHEILAAPIRSALHLSKIKFYAWVYSIVVVIFTLVYRKFLRNLPGSTLRLLVLGGSSFVFGAFGLDLLGGYLNPSLGHQTIAYLSLAVLEEVFEMGGMIVIVYTLLLYMGSEIKWIKIKIAE